MGMVITQGQIVVMMGMSRRMMSIMRMKPENEKVVN